MPTPPLAQNSWCRFASLTQDFLRRHGVVIIVAVLWSLSLKWQEGEWMWTSHSPGFEPARSVGVVDAWKRGILDARWLPSFDQNYGYPIFSYHSPLFSWATGVVLAITDKPVLSLKISLFFFFLVGGIGCRILAADYWRIGGRRNGGAGTVAFVAWASASYLLTNIFVRGSMAEFAGSCFVPWVLWGLWLLTADGRRPLLGGGVLAAALALVILSHNAMAVYVAMLIPLLAVLFRPAGWKGWAAWAGGGAAALCLTAFFVVPVAVEHGFVRLDSVAFSDVRDHFLRLDHLLAITQWNLGSSGQAPDCTMPRHQGALLPFALATGLAALLLFRERALRAKTAVAMGLVLVTLFMAMRPSVWLWDHLRVLQYTQFPWRWLSLNAVALALLTPAFAAALQQRFGDVARGCHAVALAAVFTLNLALCDGPNLLWQRWEYPQTIAVIRGEATRTAVTDEYGPIWRPTSLAHHVGANIAELDGMPMTNARTLLRRWRWHSGERTRASSVVIGVNYFPAWRAFWIPEGPQRRTEIPLNPTPDGLIRLELPPGGAGHLELRFTNTPIRLAMKLLSASTLAAGIVLVASVRRKTKRQPAMPAAVQR